MNLRSVLTVFLLAGLFLASCKGSSDEGNAAENNTGQEHASGNTSEIDDAEVYVTSIDTAELLSGKSLYYSKEDGTSVSVEFWLNDSNQVIKMIEYYTTSMGGTINRKCFYYRDNHKYVTKEYFDDSKEDEMAFVERITYYKGGKPAVAKMRRAQFEDQLENEAFLTMDPKDCSDKRAYEVLGQTGEYVTTFRGFIKDEHMTYLLVGPDVKDGYISSISVQYSTPLIRKLLANEREMIGTPLVVNFETTVSEIGFEFQVLTGLSLDEEE